jgi:hypothetical protein
MPYKSDAQRKFFHSPGAAKAGISKSDVKKFDKESKGKKLPEKVMNPYDALKKKNG